MKTIARPVAAFALAACTALPALAADVNVSLDFGRVDVARYGRPVLVAPRPVVVAPPPRPLPPVYVYAPVEHQRNWRRWCGRYDACGAPVYFVQDRWYRDRVAHERWNRRDERRDDRHDRRDDRRDDRHDRHDDRHDRRDDRRN